MGTIAHGKRECCHAGSDAFSGRLAPARRPANGAPSPPSSRPAAPCRGRRAPPCWCPSPARSSAACPAAVLRGPWWRSALEVMADGGTRLEAFGYSSEDAFAVGLTCGGELEVHIEPLATLPGRCGWRPAPMLARTPAGPLALIRRVDAARAAAPSSSRILRHFRRRIRPSWPPCWDVRPLSAPRSTARTGAAAARQHAGGGRPAGAAAARRPDGPGPAGAAGGLRRCRCRACAGCRRGRLRSPSRCWWRAGCRRRGMLVFGANDFGAALLPAAKLLGYRVTLCDARPAFAAQDRFAAADEVVTDWPHRYLAAEAAAGRIDARTVVCVLTHDPKFDIPLLEDGAWPGPCLRRRHGLAAQPPPARRCPARRRRAPDGTGPAAFTDRPGPRRRHAGRGGRLHHRRTDRRPQRLRGLPATSGRHRAHPLPSHPRSRADPPNAVHVRTPSTEHTPGDRMDMNTIEAVVRTTDPADWRDGDAWLAGGTVLFSYGSYAFGPEPLRRLLDLGSAGWPAITVTEDGHRARRHLHRRGTLRPSGQRWPDTAPARAGPAWTSSGPAATPSWRPSRSGTCPPWAATCAPPCRPGP